MIRILALAAALLAVPTPLPADEPAPIECRWASPPITIDGTADEPAWKNAVLIDHFERRWLPEDKRAPKTATKARLLWDRDYFYFFADMEDADLYADITEHNGRIWNNDVFEVFLKPDQEKPGYYEFEVNAAAAVLDLFLPRRGAGGFDRFKDDTKFHVEVKVKLDGTLNKWTDRDRGWQVEGKIPWRDFIRTGGRPEPDEVWSFSLCRYDYSVDFEGPDTTSSSPLTQPNFHRFEDYLKLRFVRPAPEEAARRFGLEPRVATSRVVGSPEPPLPYRAVRTLPALKTKLPICVTLEPGSRRLWLVDQQWNYGPSRLARTGDDPADGQLETLLDFGPAVAYGVLFHPDYAKNGYVYIGLNGAFEHKEKHTRIVRYTVSRQPPHKLDPASALVIIEWPSDGHNGGAICFGKDGMLYVTSGDGTSDSDTNVVGQRLDLLTAKVLRIDVDHPTADRAYSIPKDNPFLDHKGARPETWAYGLRNPWRMSADPVTGAIWVGNNGQDLWEQVYRVERGANYGWSVYEGNHSFYPKRELGPTPFTGPTFDHPHSEARSLTGGLVYRGKRFPELRGAYLYGDYSTGKIWAGRHDGKQVTFHREIADTPLQISDFGLDADGELLILDHQTDGGVYTLEPTPPSTQHTEFPRRLSETGLFRSVARHEVAAGVIPYDVNSPLWSDGSIKSRFLALPPTDASGKPSRIEMSPTGAWKLPDLTVLVKSFALELKEGDPASRRYVETRLLTRQQGEWVGYSYLWNDEQTEATLVDSRGADLDFTVTAADGKPRQQRWHYPSRSECMVCHSRAAGFVLGPRTSQMNKENEYNGVRINQLALFEELGLVHSHLAREYKDDLRQDLKTAGLEKTELDQELNRLTSTRDQRSLDATSLLPKSPAGYPRLADPYDDREPLAARARSYLEANCAHCHQPAGGGNALFDVRFETSTADMNALDVKPQHHTFDLDDPRLIAPGSPERSVLLHRISIRGRGQMPQLGTDLIDHRAVALLRDWIKSTSKASE